MVDTSFSYERVLTRVAESRTNIAPSQSTSGHSIAEMVQAALHDIGNESLTETQEELSLVLGGQMRDGRRINQRAEHRRNLALLQKWILQAENVLPGQADQLTSRFSHLHASQDPLAVLRQSDLDSGQMVQLLATLLADKSLSAAQRRKLRSALYELMEDKTWALSLFTNLALGPAAKKASAQLKQIYHCAADNESSLVKWFQKFQTMQDRDEKIQILIRTLAFELSAQRPDLRDPHLAAVVMDLKRIVLFLGLSDYCHKLARDLALSHINGDTVLLELLTTIDQPWVMASWLRVRCTTLKLPWQQHYFFTQRMAELIKFLAEPCFRDTSQKDMLQSAYVECLDNLAEEERT